MKNIKYVLAAIIFSVSFIVGTKDVFSAGTLTDSFLEAQNGGTYLKTTYLNNIGKEIPSEFTNFSIGANSTNLNVKTANQKALTEDEKNAYLDIENFIGENISEAQKVSLTDEKNVYLNDSQQYISAPVVGYSATYEQMGIYDNHVIDIVLTVMGFEESITTNSNTSDPAHSKYNSASLPPYLYFAKREIGFGMHNLNWIDIKIDFIDHTTKKPVSVKGNTTYWDVDGRQGLLLDDTTTNIYISNNNNILKSTSINSREYVYDSTDGTNCEGNTIAASYFCDAKNMETPEYAFTETFSGSSLRRTYNALIRKTDRKVGGYISLTGKSPISQQIPKPTKTVDKQQVEIGEKYTYTIHQNIPQLLEKYYLKEFKIEDTLEECLDVDTNKIKIYDDTDTDVTNKFNISNTGQKIEITLINSSDASFYGKTYRITIETKIKNNTNLNKYKQGSEFIIPNQATRIYKDYNNKEVSDDTNIVKVKSKILSVVVPPTSATISKIIIFIGVVAIIISGVVVYKIIRRKKMI